MLIFPTLMVDATGTQRFLFAPGFHSYLPLWVSAIALWTKRIFQIIAFTQMRRRARFHSRDNRLKGVAASAGVTSLRRWKRISGELRRMASRALSLATVLLLIGFWAAGRAEAQENLDAGKTPSQIFAGTCTA